ncbi:MAG: DUF6797 domain-containing protein [Balneolales bacterium]
MKIIAICTIGLISSGFLGGCRSEAAINESHDDDDEPKGYYQTMDYGPVIAESIKLEWPENSFVRKGLGIDLGNNSAMIFDTDLMRFAAGSVGGWLDISESDYTSYKGSEIASIEGRQVFGTPEIAGWAKNGSFHGLRNDDIGNLPRDWAHYQGYYRSDDKVVLSYSVGETNVLELPETAKHDGIIAFTRTIQVGASENKMKALISGKQGSWSAERVGDHEMTFSRNDTTYVIGLANASEYVKLSESEVGIELHFQPSESLRTVKVLLFEIPSSDGDKVDNILGKLRNSELPNLQAMTQGGPAQWDKEIEVSGVLSGDNSGYVIDRIPVPFDNPWGSWMRLSGLDFFKDGTRAAVSTWNGDVWIVSGIDETLDNIKWRRFASGLFYPMGVAIVDEEVYVTERSQLTRLHDLNGNGEADYYENFNNDGIVYPKAHSLGLEVDSEGNFYFYKNGNRVPSEIPQHGALIQVSPDGKSREVYARGYRGANTLGIGDDDMILGADQEGNWVPVDRIDVIKQDGFYGDRRHGGEHLEVGEFEPPITWTPKDVNNSSGMITYAGDSRWGPLSGQWIMGSYGQRTLFAVLTEEMGGKLQGGIVKLPVESTSGLMRGQVNPNDGQLYVAGLRGWQTLATDDASFERIRYAGGNANLPKEINITPKGVQLTFTDPLDPESAQNLQNYHVERWDYIYSSKYGSPEVLPDNSQIEARDTMKVSSLTISENKKTVFLELPDMRSVMQMKIAYELTFGSGQVEENVIHHTVNWVTEADANDKPEWQQRILANHQEAVASADQKEEVSSDDDSAPEWYRKGMASFEQNCTSCHISGGVAPDLSTSEWAGGKREVLVRILLQGKRGNRGIMTPFSWMDDEEIATITSYIRARWHELEKISPSEVKNIRDITNSRTKLWTEEELRNL